MLKKSKFKNRLIQKVMLKVIFRVKQIFVKEEVLRNQKMILNLNMKIIFKMKEINILQTTILKSMINQ